MSPIPKLPIVPKKDRRCCKCGETKPARDYYAGTPSVCMTCKRAMSQAYKKRTDYNRAYREKMKTGGPPQKLPLS